MLNQSFNKPNKNKKFRQLQNLIHLVKKELLPITIRDSIWVKLSVFSTILLLFAYLKIICQNQDVINEATSQRQLSEKSLKQSDESNKLLEKSISLMEKQINSNEIMVQVSKSQYEMNIIPRIEILPEQPRAYGHKDSVNQYTTFSLTLLNDGTIPLKNIKIRAFYYFCQKKNPTNFPDSSDYVIKIDSNKTMVGISTSLKLPNENLEIFSIAFPDEISFMKALNIGERKTFKLNVRSAYWNSNDLIKNLKKHYNYAIYLRLIVDAQRSVDAKNFNVLDRLYRMLIGFGNPRSSILVNSESDLNESNPYLISPTEVRQTLEKLKK